MHMQCIVSVCWIKFGNYDTHISVSYLRDPELSIDNFRRQLKTFLFARS